MRAARALVLLAVLILAACGDGDEPDDAASGSSTSSTAASSSTSIAETAKSGASTTPPAPATTRVTTGAAQGAPATTSPPATTQAQGLIHGRVERDCSSNPNSGSGCNNQSSGVAGATVQLRSTGSKVLAVTTTSGDGTFQFVVAAGRYVIREESTGVSQERDVAAGRTTFVTLVIPES